MLEHPVDDELHGVRGSRGEQALHAEDIKRLGACLSRGEAWHCVAVNTQGHSTSHPTVAPAHLVVLDARVPSFDDASSEVLQCSCRSFADQEDVVEAIGILVVEAREHLMREHDGEGP